MQQMLEATLVNAADEAPAKALILSADFKDVAILMNHDNPVVATGSA